MDGAVSATPSNVESLDLSLSLLAFGENYLSGVNPGCITRVCVCVKCECRLCAPSSLFVASVGKSARQKRRRGEERESPESSVGEGDPLEKEGEKKEKKGKEGETTFQKTKTNLERARAAGGTTAPTRSRSTTPTSSSTSPSTSPPPPP